MIKVDIFSGFLGAGKTTLIKKMIKEAYNGEKLVLVENEFGDIGIDSSFLKDAGIEITEMNAGCICCTLVGDFTSAITKVAKEFSPDRILIEPSGVGKLSDIAKALQRAEGDFVIDGTIAVVDAKKCAMYMRNFGEFFVDQVEHANSIILSHLVGMEERKIEENIELLKGINHEATIITTDWEKLDGEKIRASMQSRNRVSEELANMKAEHGHYGQGHACHNGEHDHDEHCECGCHDHHGHEHGCDHDEHCECGCHDHHGHEHGCGHDEHCECGCHDHHEHHEHEHACHNDEHDHHHHHADEVFETWGIETARKFDEKKLAKLLEGLDEISEYGLVLRAKGSVEGTAGTWMHFDYIPGEYEVRMVQTPDLTGRICVIGSKLDKAKIEKAFMG